MTEPVMRSLLLVAADPAERGRLKRELEACGWCVRVAPDAPSALGIYAEHPGEIRAAVVDLQLPGLQGARVLAELGRLTPSLLLCAMAANLSPYAAAEFRRLTDTPLFCKPVHGPQIDAAFQGLCPDSAVRDRQPRGSCPVELAPITKPSILTL